MFKKILFVILLMGCGKLFAETPSLKVNMADGTSKIFLLNDINNIKIKNGDDNFFIKIYQKGTLAKTYSSLLLDSVNFQQEQNINKNLLIFYKNSLLNDYFPLQEIDSITFTPLPVPTITTVTPNIVKKNDIITISGSNFGNSQNGGKVRIFAQDSSIISYESMNIWTDNKIIFNCNNVKAGKLSVIANGKKSNEVDISLIPLPTITSINPTSFSVGDIVTINGKNFGAKQNNGIILFNTVNAVKINSWTDSKIVCVVPSLASTGTLNVIVNDNYSNTINYKIISSLEMVAIPNGSFTMGNTGIYSGTIYIPEFPTHQVTISNQFYMSKYEINQATYSLVVGSNPSNHKGNMDLPVEKVNWYDAVAFCNKLSQRDGFNPCYTINGTSVTCDWYANGYRLPTEAEWEYCCKAGTSTDFYTGNSESNLAECAWYSANSGDSTHLPGLLKPNKFGLYDMHGNVNEWVWDWRGNYTSGSEVDPIGPSSGTVKLLRGGSWHQGFSTGTCRSSVRLWEDQPTIRSSTDGIRVVRLK